MNTKMILVPSKANQGFMLSAAGAAGAAGLLLVVRLIASTAFGWWFGFSMFFDFFLMVATAVLLFIAAAGKVPLLAAYIPAIILGLNCLFTGSPLIGLFYTGAAVVALLASLGVLKVLALDGLVTPDSKGVCLLSAGLFLGAIVIDFISMIISLFRYVPFFFAFFNFVTFAIFLAALALSIFCTEYKEVAAGNHPNQSAPQYQQAPPQYQQAQYQQAPPQYQQPPRYAQGAAPQGTQRAYDPNMFKVPLQVPGFCGLVKHILLLIFTFGIWSYIWVYRTTEFLNRTDREQQSAGLQVLLCILVPFYAIYWYYKNAQRIDRFAAANGVYSDLETPCLVCSILLSGGAAVLMQEKLNCVLYTIYLNGGQMPQPAVPQYQQPPQYQQAPPQYQQPQYQQPQYQQAPPQYQQSAAPQQPVAPQNPANQ